MNPSPATSQPSATATDPSVAAGRATSGDGVRRSPTAAVLALIAILTCAAYAPALNGARLWDDNAHITKPELRSVDGLYRIWFERHATQQYYPLLHSLFWLEHRLWGAAMLGYHVANLLLHLTAALLVYAVLRNLNIPGALLATALFALHPVQVETVAWVTEQKNTLSAVFYLSAMWAYLQFDQTRARRWYALALGLFVLGLFSKTVVASLPAALLVIFWWRRGRTATIAEAHTPFSWRRDVLPLVPFFLLGLIGGLITASVERELIGYETQPYVLDFAQRILLAGRAVWFYLATLLWPINLVFIYPRWTLDPAQLWQWLFPVAAVAALAVCFSVRKWSRAPLAGALFFVGTLFPALGFVNVYPFRYSFVADHFQYLASLGVFVPLAGAAAVWFASRAESIERAGTLVCAALIGVLATLTFVQSRMYGNAETLFETTINKNPDCWMAYCNLGLIRMDQGNLADATRLFEKTVQFAPEAREGHANLGVAYGRAGRTQEGIEQLEQALEMNPYLGKAHYNLGVALLTAGRPQEAIPVLEEAVRREPHLADAFSNLGTAYFALGKPNDAIPYFREALRLQTDFPKIHNNLGAALFATGQTDQAIKEFQLAVQAAPHDAASLNDLGWALMATGRPQDALAPLEAAVQQAPDRMVAQNNLGKALLDLGRPEEAAPRFMRAIELAPDNPLVQFNLAQAHAAMHRTADALADGQKAIDRARAQSQTQLVQQIEAWLTALRANNPPPPVTLPSTALPPNTP